MTRTSMLVVACLASCGREPPSGDAAPPEPTADVTPSLATQSAAELTYRRRCPASAPCAVTTEGVVMGTSDATPGVSSFKGVPYARPPVGSLRFRAPLAPAPRELVLVASRFGPQCPQLDRGRLEGDEDCLTLNVWHRAAASAAPRPVMVWLHGGGFLIGSSSQGLYDGAALAAREDVVVVSLNYRLGALGFLAHAGLVAEAGTAGNYGLLDQLRALEWVRDNAAAFGGDPGRVTLFGQSAGGVSVGALLAAPRAHGLFHRAISQSGPFPDMRMTSHLTQRTPGFVPGAPPRESALEQGARYAQAIGCARATDADTVACLRDEKTVEQVLTTLPATVLPLPNARGVPVNSYLPVVDGQVLTMSAFDAATVGPSAGVPLIIGFNADEGTLVAGNLAVASRADYEAIAGELFGPLAPQVLAQYPAAGFAGATRAFSQMIGDFAFGWHTRRVLQARAAAGLPTRSYVFSEVPLLPALGAFHGAELGYVFGTFSREPSPEQRALGATLQRLWADFARGEPPPGRWPAWAETGGACGAHLQLQLDTRPVASPCGVGPSSGATVVQDYEEARLDFWDTLWGSP